MATKSITKNIDIRDKKLCRNFISALENAEGKGSKKVELQRSFTEIKSSEAIRKFFGDKE